MPFISSFIYCDGINMIMTPQGPKEQLGPQLQAITPIAFPSNYTFSIVCSLDDLARDKTSTIKIQFVDPDGEVLYDTKNIDVSPVHTGTEKKVRGIQCNIEMRNLVFRREGIYATKIFVDDTEIGEYKIKVFAEGERI